MPITGLDPYDDGNVFARILRGEVPARVVLETPHALVMHDVGPQAPTHLLVIPRGRYVSWADWSRDATDAEIAGLVRAAGEAARLAGLEADGFRIVANHGTHAGQEVGHFHLHILAGRPLGTICTGSAD